MFEVNTFHFFEIYDRILSKSQLLRAIENISVNAKLFVHFQL